MKRIGLAALAIAVAAVALWHPAPRPPVQEIEPGSDASQAPRRVDRARPGAIVYVAGAVRRPGLYRVGDDSRVDDAVRLAGGMLATADAGGVNLAARLADGDEIFVPAIGDRPTAARSARRTHRGHSNRKRKKAHVPSAAIDLNAATEQSLESVPGIGPAIAQRIVEMREREGPYDTIDELLDVAGMTPQRLERARPYLFAS